MDPSVGTIGTQDSDNVSITGGSVSGITDISVADGGTGKSSWTQYLIPYSDTTSSFSQIAIGTAGQVLTSNGAGAVATFQNLNILISAVPGSDHLTSGNTIILTAHDAQAFGDICFLNASGEAALASAAVVASSGAVVMATGNISANAEGTYLLLGTARDGSWAWNVGGLVYLSAVGTTGNTLTQTPPSASNNIVQIVGVATHANRMYFNPSLSQVENF